MITKNRSFGTRIMATRDGTTVKVMDVWRSPDLSNQPPYEVGWTNEPEISMASVPLGSESIAYTIRGTYNTCEHSKRRLTIAATGYTGRQFYDVGGLRWITTYEVEDPWSLCGLSAGIAGRPELGALEEIPAVSADWESEYSSRAVRTMWPGTQSSNLSFLNFLWELRDFKATLRSARALRNRMLRVPQLQEAFGHPRSWRDRLRLARLAEGKVDLLSTAAEAHLTNEFAIKPFLKDCKRIYYAIRDIDAEVDRLKNNVGKRLTSHYSTELKESILRTDRTLDLTWLHAHNLYRIERKAIVLANTYHATMDYSYELSQRDLPMLKAYVALDRLGVRLDPSIPWNAYPWTFVVDWVVRVGDFLEQFSYRNIRPIVTIHGFCHSVKRHVVTEMLIQQNPGSVAANPIQTVASEDYQTYVRRPYFPNYYSAIQLSGVNVREFLLAASLVRVRKLRRRHR